MRALKLRSTLQSLCVGIIAGMRSAAAPAIASHILSRNKSKLLVGSGISFMQSDRWASGLKVMAAGELIADKLPFAPARIKPVGVTARALSGGLSGAAISKANDDNVIAGIALGSFAAIASTFAFYWLRREIAKKAGIYDPVLGVVEDSLALAGCIMLAETY